MLDEQLLEATDADLFFVGEVFKPPGEFVGALNLPGHAVIMP